MASHFILKDTEVYWLKNGFKILSFTSIRNVTVGNLSYQLASTVVQAPLNESYSAQGYYQCVVFASKIMRREVTSKKLHLQFPGNHFLCASIL